MSELEICPFCGSTATASTHCIEPGWWICVINCDGINDNICSCQIITGGDTEMEAYELAVRAWNTRHERTCHTVEDNGVLHCSECGAGAEKQSWAYWNNCPNCGAKVIGG